MITDTSQVIAPHFYEAHRNIRDGEFYEFWLSGGRGSTKTSFIAAQILLGLMRDENANAVVFRKTKDTLRDSVFNDFQRMVVELNISGYFTFKYSPLEVIYTPTGQSIKFRGLDDPEKVKGLKFAKGYAKFIWFEELSEFYGMEEIRNVKQTLIRGTDAQFITMYSYNPPKNHNSWVNVEAKNKIKGRYSHHSNYLTVPNKWLGKDFIRDAELLKLNNPQAYNHEYLGIATGNDELLVFNGKYTVKEFETPDFNKLTGGRPYYGVDWGFSNDPTTMNRMFCMDGCLYIEYEANGTGVEMEELPQLFSAIPLSRKFKSYADCSRPETVSFVKRQGFNIEKSLKWTGCVEDGVAIMKSFKHIYIHPRCVHTIKEFGLYSYKVDKSTKEILPVIIDKDNHHIDAIRYGLQPIIKRENGKAMLTREFIL